MRTAVIHYVQILRFQNCAKLNVFLLSEYFFADFFKTIDLLSSIEISVSTILLVVDYSIHNFIDPFHCVGVEGIMKMPKSFWYCNSPISKLLFI